MIMFVLFICLFTDVQSYDNRLTEEVLARLAHLEGQFNQLKEKYDEIKKENTDLKAEMSKCVTVEILNEKLDLNDARTTHDKNRRLTVRNSDGIGFYARVRPSGTLGPHQTIEFDHIHDNSGNGYDSSHGHFTAPLPGLYFFTTTIYSTDGKGVHCELLKNGVIIGNLKAPVPGYSSSTLNAVIQMNAGDMVWVRHTGSTSQVLNANDYSSFAGFLISQ